jgi:hypothetical protein
MRVLLEQYNAVPLVCSYSIARFKSQVRKVFAEQLIVLVQLHPQLIVDLKKEFLEFVGNRVNVADGG